VAALTVRGGGPPFNWYVRPPVRASNWQDRPIPEGASDTAISQIEGASLLVGRFGKWPPFHDAEVLALDLDRGNHWRVIQSNAWDQRIPPSLTATFFVFDHLYAATAPERKETMVALRFEEFERFGIEGFNHQNPIIGLGIAFEYSTNLRKNLFAVDWGGTALPHEVSFTCGRIRVVNVEPMVWRPQA
jgi:hypothetical protein